MQNTLAYGHFAYILGSIGAFFTAFYSLRLVYLSFLSSPNGYRPVIVNAHESSLLISLPLGVLALPSIFLGYIIKDVFIGLGTPYWNNALFILPAHTLDAEFLPSLAKLTPVILSVIGGVSAFFYYHYQSESLFSLKISSYGS